jgi:DNA invertase Pin-like site-specific DNA recombinase
MNTGKVKASHLQRNAFLYIRQSTLKQVMENTESTKRQYALRQQAVALGWPLEKIVVIDCDLGQSGASKERDGFRQLVAEVSLGKAGIVLGLEVSRLARSSTEWHRLLEICALTGTLILDEDGIYDPNDFNDRLLLGLKGTMSEAELHVLKSRLRGGILNKARRGELKSPLPIGFVYDDQGRVILDPDQQVQEAIRIFFQTFRRTGSAFSTVRAFNEKRLKFPKRLHKGFRKGELIWEPLMLSKALQTLHNPRYTGAFFYGRSQVQKTANGAKTTSKLSQENWHALIHDAHEGYISWEEFEENRRQLKENARARGLDRKSSPREGNALLQGIVICGLCGRRMTVRYHTKKQHILPSYLCQREEIEHAQKKPCQVIPGAVIDDAVGELLLEVITPLSLEVTLAVQEELNARAAEVQNQHLKQLERLRYEAELARRRYMRVDPDNRLVASQLESEWNDRLRALTEAQEEYEKQCQSSSALLDEQQRLEILQIATDFPNLWRSKDLPARERKRIARLILEDVTLLKKEQLFVHVRFKGGACKTLTLKPPRCAWQIRKTAPGVVQEIDRLLEYHTHGEIATILNENGFKSGEGKPFSSSIVWKICHNYSLKDRFTRLREAGMLTQEEIATRLDVSPLTVRIWRKNGLLKGHKVNDKNEYLYEPPGENAPQKNKRKNLAKSHLLVSTLACDQGGAV